MSKKQKSKNPIVAGILVGFSALALIVITLSLQKTNVVNLTSDAAAKCGGKNYSCYKVGTTYTNTDEQDVTVTNCQSIGAAPSPNKICESSQDICCGFIGGSSGRGNTNVNASCAISLLTSQITVQKGATYPLTASVIPTNSQVQWVTFGVYPIEGQTGSLTVSPSYDNTSPYTSTLTGVTEGQALVQGMATVKGSSSASCQTTAIVTVTP